MRDVAVDILPVPIGFHISLRRRNYNYEVFLMYSIFLIFLPISLCEITFAVYHPEYSSIKNTVTSINFWFLYDSFWSLFSMALNLLFFVEYRRKLLFQMIYNFILGLQLFWLLLGCDFFYYNLPSDVFALLWLSLIIGFGKVIAQVLLISKKGYRNDEV